nr:integrase, catalytic region, zinc finger, CCHC-type, peptidase aspartic, catalytic [Tanacetum cinerariifolium]
MSTQQDIYAAGSEIRPSMLNKENYVPWSSRLLRYAKSKPNGKLIHISILNGSYVRKMIPEPGDANRDITVTKTFHLQTDDELSDKELKQIEVDDQAIQTILLGLPEDIYAAVDSYKTAQEIWLRVQQMMKGSDIRIQKKKAKNKHFPEKIASNLKFLNNMQPEWSRHMARSNGGNQFRQYAGQNAGIPAGYNDVIGNQAKEKGCCLSSDTVVDCSEGRGRNLTPSRRQASTSGTQTDSAPVYDTDGSAEVHENCDDNEIFNMFTQEDQYTELLKPIPESHQVPQNDNDVISEDTSVEQAKFVGDFESLAKKADDSLAKHKAMELDNERLLKAVVSQEVMNIVQKESVVDTSDIQTELERTKERIENCIIKKISPDKISREAKKVPNTVNASSRKKPITVSQPNVITKKNVNSNLNGLPFTGLDNTKTRRPQPRSNTKNDRVPSVSKSSRSKNKEAKLEEHHRNLLLSKNNEHMSSACYPDSFMVRRLRLFQAHDKKSKDSHQFCLEVYENWFSTIELYFVKTDYQLAGIFTKALPTDRFNYLVRRLGMRSLSPKELERQAKSL